MIKHNMDKSLDINLMNFELSSNYIAFFDKLEKSNYVYENIIHLSQNVDLDFIKKEKIIDYCVEGQRKLLEQEPIEFILETNI